MTQEYVFILLLLYTPLQNLSSQPILQKLHTELLCCYYSVRIPIIQSLCVRPGPHVGVRHANFPEAILCKLIVSIYWRVLQKFRTYKYVHYKRAVNNT